MAITEKEIREFKDKWAQDKGYENWYDYKDYCESNGYDESEIGYDRLMVDLANEVLDALRPRMKNAENPQCPNHPDARTYTSITGNICCTYCFEVIK
jgi:LPS sulfotransferase NodH